MLTNPSQLILRNSDEFAGLNLLIINYESDTLAQQCLESAKQVTALALDYHHHLTLAPLANDNLSCYFGHKLPDTLNSEKFDAVIVYFPKAKPLAEYLFTLAANHLNDDGLLLIVGENKGGIKSVGKLLPDFFTPAIKLDNARHSLLYRAFLTRPAPALIMQDWVSEYTLATPQGEITICNFVGVFSEKKLDLGTELLLSHLPQLNGRVLDFGCGAGVITVALLKQYPSLNIECIDINAMALASCQLTLKANKMQAKVYPSDGFNQINDKFDGIISNPPFHDGLDSTFAIANAFVSQSAARLNPKGVWQIVANRHLPYADNIANAFGSVNVPAENNKYKLYLQKV
ncbi:MULTISPECIES: methyltransferase [Pseudomonadati]|uniref:Ribosomal RNA small subunit methyltransferase C n=1 Tax=Shewanella aestuarii TaxID=1028752 RepID=A0ABT0L056_9GAMM|nr:methyltransferase [Shewanella aestuarii]MCL1116641.1 methyltransferase [Shewanella aestuarii]GGN72527.1 ribosomal RNA small subunit methyltransferase C [Shewanella aestuarii]